MELFWAFCIGLSLDGFYKVLSLKYETNYFSLSDYEGEKRMSLFSYVLFRFVPPLFALILASTLFKGRPHYWLLLFLVLFFGVILRHSLAFYKQFKYKYYAPAFLHVLVILVSVILVIVSDKIANIYELNQYLPTKEGVIDNLWSALVLTVFLGLFFKFVGVKKIDRNELLLKSLTNIDKKLVILANSLSDKYNADKTIVASIMALENLNRPKWIRNIEKIVPWTTTYGIMQVKSDKKLDDAKSIEIAIKNYFIDTKRYRNTDDYDGAEKIRKKIVSKYNSGDSYYTQIESYGWYILDKFKEIVGAMDDESIGADSTKETYEKSAKLLSDNYEKEGSYKHIVETAVSYMKNTNSALDLGCGSGRNTGIIRKYYKNYIGLDYSEEMLKLLKSKSNEVVIRHEDFRFYKHLEKVDAIFAFDSLIHVNKDEMLAIINRFGTSLVQDGIFVITFLLKFDEYTECRDMADEFGVRKFYYYSFEDIKIISEKAGLKPIKFDIMHSKGNKRAYIILQKQKRRI